GTPPLPAGLPATRHRARRCRGCRRCGRRWPSSAFLDAPAAQARLTAVGGLGRHRPRRAGLIERIWSQVADRPGRLSCSPEERAELESYWRADFEEAQAPDFRCCLGPNQQGAAARRVHYRDRGIPRELVRRWSEQHRRQPATRGSKRRRRRSHGTCAPAFLERVAAVLWSRLPKLVQRDIELVTDRPFPACLLALS